LSGRTLDLDGASWGSAAASLRPLLPATEVVHSHFVSFGTEDEIEFLGACRAALTERGLGGNRSPAAPGAWPRRRDRCTASLMLHGLKRAESVAIQETGLGLHRLLGCGNFIPHKSVAAVGE
jgi:hypothetical protein